MLDKMMPATRRTAIICLSVMSVIFFYLGEKALAGTAFGSVLTLIDSKKED